MLVVRSGEVHADEFFGADLVRSEHSLALETVLLAQLLTQVVHRAQGLLESLTHGQIALVSAQAECCDALATLNAYESQTKL